MLDMQARSEHEVIRALGEDDESNEPEETQTEDSEESDDKSKSGPPDNSGTN